MASAHIATTKRSSVCAVSRQSRRTLCQLWCGGVLLFKYLQAVFCFCSFSLPPVLPFSLSFWFSIFPLFLLLLSLSAHFHSKTFFGFVKCRMKTVSNETCEKLGDMCSELQCVDGFKPSHRWGSCNCDRFRRVAIVNGIYHINPPPNIPPTANGTNQRWKMNGE